MRAIVLDDIPNGTMRLSDSVPIPSPAKGEVLIQVHVASVNYADILLREGLYSLTKPPPVIPGLDAAGTIVEVGDGVLGLSVGARVAAFCGGGAYAEYVTASADLCWRLSDRVDDDQAATLPTVGVTSFNLLTLAGRLRKGASVMVHSSVGSVGSTCIQLARFLGAGTVIGTVGHQRKMESASLVGCDHVINYQTERDLPRAVRDITADGLNLILNGTGGTTLATDLDCLADFGRLVVYGNSSRGEGLAPVTHLTRSNQSIVGYSTTGYSRAHPEVLRAAGHSVLAALDQGAITFLLDRTFPLEDAQKAHDLIESRRSTGKVLLRVQAQ